MKKSFKIFLFLVFCFPFFVSAATCNLPDESTMVTYYAGDYPSEPYCVKLKDGCGSGSKTLCSSGCFPLTIASILTSYGKNVTPVDIARYLCSNTSGFKDAANKVTYGGIVTNTKFLDQFDMEIIDIPDTIDALNEALDAKKMVLASVNNRGIFPNGSTHYIGIAMRRENGDYYVINTNTKTDTTKMSGWYTREQILVNVFQALNNGIWSVEPKNCNSYTGGSGSGGNQGSGGVGKVDDPFPNIFPGKMDSEDGCGAIFVDQNGDLNELGQFVNDLFGMIKIAAPVLVIILSTIDYVKAIATANADDLKKANKRTIKRAIAGLIIFFLPFLLDILFELFGLYDISKCQIVK